MIEEGIMVMGIEEEEDVVVVEEVAEEDMRDLKSQIGGPEKNLVVNPTREDSGRIRSIVMVSD